MKKYDEDLNTTLIFVSFVRGVGGRLLTGYQAGLFSAVASAFIIEVNSQLHQDPNNETAALLRVLIHKIDNTTFGNDIPILPQWTGPPQTIVHVQAILFASLAASLFSAFLAMLGKQWLNRYASTDMRGTTVERSQNRQRKLDGVVAWYFDHVMESLPLMLQAALLLLGCALSRYLWGINITVAFVVLGVTSLGIIFYIFAVVAGTASESCPYQTPIARIFRHIFRCFFHHTRYIFAKSSGFIQSSSCRHLFIKWRSSLKRPWYSVANIANSLPFPLLVPMVAVIDFCNIGQAIARWLVTFCRTVYRRVLDTLFPQTHSLDQETTVLDLRCISWMLQTSLDKTAHLSTLEHLATMQTLAGFDPTLIADCFGAFVGCLKVDVNKLDVAVVQGFEQLATASALSLLNTTSHLFAKDPTSSALEDVRQRYLKVFSTQADFHGHQFYYVMNAVRCLFVPSMGRRSFQWNGYKPSIYEHTIVVHNLVKIAWFKYQRTRGVKVPRWILRFALHSLSLDPLPPASVVADCLLIVAIDLGCDLSNTRTTTSDERCVCVRQMNVTLTLN